MALIHIFGLKSHYSPIWKLSFSPSILIIFTTKHRLLLPDTDCMSIHLTFYILRTNSSVTFNIFSEKYFIQNSWTPIIFTTHVTFSHLRHYNLSFCLHAVVSPNKDVENTLLTTPQKLHSQLLNICSLECFIPQLQSSNSNGRVPNINKDTDIEPQSLHQQINQTWLSTFVQNNEVDNVERW